MSATRDFMAFYKRLSSGRERKILEKSNIWKIVKRTLGLCTTLYVCGCACVCVCVDHTCVVLCVIFSKWVSECFLGGYSYVLLCVCVGGI